MYPTSTYTYTVGGRNIRVADGTVDTTKKL